ncbi:MAG TPA: hypothetical protein VHZ95_18430, partial [Polyangiales bacterium]|nr:hypothetical protein [Polyangiales bacterium]
RALDAQRLRALLQVHPGATCVNAETLASAIEPWLREDTLQSDVKIAVEGSASDPRDVSFRVVRANETVAHRAFEPGPERCDYLHAALGLAIALALRASLLDELTELLPDDPEALTRGWALALAGDATYQLLPSFAPGIEARAELGLGPHVAIRFGALGLFADGIAFDRSTGGFDAGLIAARADACLRIPFGHGLHAQLCSGLLGGALYARGDVAGTRRSSLLAWIALPIAIGLTVDLSRHWSLGFEPSVALPLRRIRIGVEDSHGAEVEGRSLAVAGFALSMAPVYRF